MSRRASAAVVASPLLVGAVTVLVTIVAVFLAYNANQGLPFVPTYDLKALLPSGSKLVEANFVRIGGFREGQVTSLEPRTIMRDGVPLTVAEVELELDKEVEPLPADTIVTVRQRSALGLKYLELTPGDSEEVLAPGDTIPLENANPQIEIEDLFSTFDQPTRVASRLALEGYGDGFADRGVDLNRTIEELRPLVINLKPVMETLSDPDTELDELFKQIGRAAAQAAPVADVQAELFANMADTFGAIGRNPEALRQTIERSPPTLSVAIESFRVQRPFLADFAELSRELVPASAEIPRSLPEVNDALEVGTPVLAEVPELNRLAEDVFRALDDLASNPATLLALRDLDNTVTVARPLVEFIAPHQLVCNYWNYWWTGLSEHLSAETPNGTTERVQIVTPSTEQDNSVGRADADRPADVPANKDPQEAKDDEGNPLTKQNTQFYGPAVDARGRADCQTGQTGYLDGPLITTGRYPPDSDEDGEFKGGGSHVAVDSDTPGRAGGTFVSRRLGIDSLEDVERLLEAEEER